MWPMRLDYSRDECVRQLRVLELDAYAQVLTAFRAQGDLTDGRKQLLNDLRDYFSIGMERHQAEVRRVSNDEKLGTIAQFVTDSEDTATEWLEEGKRQIPVVPRLVPHTALRVLADEMAVSQSRANARMPPPARTSSRKRGVTEQTENSGKKMCAEGISVRRKAVPSSPKPMSLVKNSTASAPKSQSTTTQPVRRRSSVTKEQIPGPSARPKAISRKSAPPDAPTSAPSSVTTPTPGRLVVVQNLPYLAHQTEKPVTGSHDTLQNGSSQQGKSVIRLSSASSQRTVNHSSVSSCKPVATVSATQVNGTRKIQPVPSNNYIILPPKRIPVSQNQMDDNLLQNQQQDEDTSSTTDIQNDHRYTNTSRSSRPQILTIPCASQTNIRSPAAGTAVRVNGSSTPQTRMEGMVNLKTIPVNKNIRTNVSSASAGSSTTNRVIRKSTNVIEIQASSDVMQSLQRNGTLSQDLIALVQKAVGMANGAPATLTIPPSILQSQSNGSSSSGHNNHSGQTDAQNVPNSSAAPPDPQPVISAPSLRSGATKCDAEQVRE